MKLPQHENRTVDRITEHYEIEKDLANKLLNANKTERANLYTLLYDELFQRVPDHPQLTRKANNESYNTKINTAWSNWLKQFLSVNSTYLELGPGDCSLAFDVAKYVSKVYAIDVSTEITASSSQPNNFELIISDGCSIPLEPNSIDVAFSNQLMEHLHPDDALEQLQNIFKVLKPGGMYICSTPNRLAGPHDVSRYFDEVATGFHLREYCIFELVDLFEAVGFTKIKKFFTIRGIPVSSVFMPVFLFSWLEIILDKLPSSTGKMISRMIPIRIIIDINLVAIK